MKPDITRLKVKLTGIVSFFVIFALWCTFTSEPDGGALGNATPAQPKNGYVLLLLYAVVLLQLGYHYYFNFKHWVIVNTFYYVSLVGIFFASLFVVFLAQF